LLTLLVVAGCSSPRINRSTEHRPFVFRHDSFAYANELVWRYDFDPVTGATKHVRQSPKRDYTHHCFVVARAARQFFDSARFDPAAPMTDTNAYRELIRKVMGQSPRHALAADQQVVIPGYSNLFDFSRANEGLLKAECGGAWQSYFQRGLWRMIFPMTAGHQQRIARQLAAKTKDHEPPVIHVVCFPKLSINHAMVLFDCKKTDQGLEFAAYDPNDPEHPWPLTFDRSGHFSLPRTRYFAGGRVDVYEIFHAWNY